MSCGGGGGSFSWINLKIKPQIVFKVWLGLELVISDERREYDVDCVVCRGRVSVGGFVSGVSGQYKPVVLRSAVLKRLVFCHELVVQVI